MNILLECRDNLYREGMIYILTQIFSNDRDKRVYFTTGSDNVKIAKSDIIVYHLAAGEASMCHRSFLNRRPETLLIGIYDGESHPFIHELPYCFKNMIFIGRINKLHDIIKLIERSWEGCKPESEFSRTPPCIRCKHRQLSSRQMEIAAQLISGKGTAKIAKEMGMKDKAISANKRMIMSRFNLKNNVELFAFLTHLKTRGILPS
ncbi:helix-turn-helix transcriptional regulator [Rahnella bonaserana]|jgi:luxR family transcriptional regulator, regulator of transport and utilization of aryl beta-glucosides